ncbi:ATP-binding protein [Acinetobacter sp. ANC 5378]|uniref:ATP-binding protein n=1 Tax=Acinetobacter sp. ANC 5378 TaxID=2731249 RepID=UPI00148FE29B|nr:ATP-binding protein [Acinetobacter sp. ANC 5378]NNG83210.1 ATP-binding protein [Acinetobacter sp. ANC 5378]
MYNNGVIKPELLFGKVNAVNANSVNFEYINLQHQATYFHGKRYGKGEVGEFILIESQVNLILGRIVEIKKDDLEQSNLEIAGRIHLLGTIQMDNLYVTAGVEYYPNINDLIYSAPHELIAQLPKRMNKETPKVELNIGYIDVDQGCDITVTPEKLFGRHLGILGSTGGGKSYTTAKILEECRKFNSKIIILDPTGEYKDFSGDDIENVHLSEPINPAIDSYAVSLPPECFQETDFIALFEPSGKVQGPKFREAIRSLRLAKIIEQRNDEHVEKIERGVYLKIGKYEKSWTQTIRYIGGTEQLENPKSPFDPSRLCLQLKQECIYPANSNGIWNEDPSSFSYCLSLISRINGITNSKTFGFVFKPKAELPTLIQKIDHFNSSDKKILRIDLSDVAFEFKAREIVANAIGRHLLSQARAKKFSDKPIVIFLDEAHNFIGKSIGNEDTFAKLDSFELIAKEGRKFGLNICLATQRPRDITEGVLSQLGTLIVHRLTNDRDREIIERACGEIDKAASDFLPSLQPGEAVLIGNDFPIPLTVNIHKPVVAPNSSGADFQDKWA